MASTDGGSSAGGLSHEVEKDEGASSAAAALSGAAASDEREPLVERLLAATFGAFADLTDATVVSGSVWYVLQLFGLLQLLLLPLGPDGTWAASAGAPAPGIAGIVPTFQGFLLTVTFTPWTQTVGATSLSPFPTLTVWALAAAFLCATLGLFLFVAARAFLANRDGASGPRALSSQYRQGGQQRGERTAMFELRTAVAVATIALPVPLTGNLLLPLLCPSGSWAGYACWTDSTHVVVAVVSILLVVLGLPFLVLAASLFQSRYPGLKLHPTAVSLGRVEALSMVIKLLLAIIFTAGQALSSWVHLLVNVLGALLLLALVITYLPFLDMTLNHVQAMLHAVLLAACVSALVVSQLQTTVAFGDAAGTGGVVLLFLVPVLGYVGWLLVGARYFGLQRSKDLSSPQAIELRLRFMVAEALRVEALASSSRSAREANADSRDAVIAFAVSSGGGGGGAGAAGAAAAAERQALMQRMNSGSCPLGFGEGAYRGNAGGGTGGAGAGAVGGGPSAVAVGGGGGGGGNAAAESRPAERIMTAQKTTFYGSFGPGVATTVVSAQGRAILAQAEALMLEGVMLFPTSPLMRMLAGHFVRALQGNIFLERVNLRTAASLVDSNTLDLRFYCFVRLRQLREEENAGVRGSMTVETRLYFDAMQEHAAQRVNACRSLILNFFSQLCERTPDLASLQRKGAAIYDATRETEAVFKELLQIVPTSVPVMRAYAEFLLDVANNPNLAENLTNDADQTEDKASKTRSMQHDARDLVFGAIVPLDFGSDNIGLIRISARDANATGGGPGVRGDALAGLGVITHGNLAALKLLGYTGSRREILGREMSLLIPPPIAAVHPRYLSGFIEDGRQRLARTTITIPLHRPTRPLQTHPLSPRPAPTATRTPHYPKPL